MTCASPDVVDLTDLEFVHEPACEHSQHHELKHSHDNGPAKWLAVYTGEPTCKCPGRGSFYVCDRWAQYIQSGVPRLVCGACGVPLSEAELRGIRFYPLNP